jgi:hypothetical protein
MVAYFTDSRNAKEVIGMAGMLRVSRSRGAMSGVLLVLLGIWGGLVPLVGPYVHYAYTPNHVWTITSGRIWLEFLPAAGAFLGGLILLASKFRPMALLGASLAAASGAWFAVGSALAPLWTHNLHAQGFPVGGHIARAMEQIGFFPGLGVVIVGIASVAIGRLSLVSVRDASVARPAEAAAGEPFDDRTPVTGETPVTARTPVTSGAPAASATTEGTAAGTRRWPGPRTMPMRRAASSKDSEPTSSEAAKETSDASEPVSSGTTTTS